MKTILKDYILVVPKQDVDRKEFEKHSGRIFKSHFNDFYEELGIPIMESYPLDGVIDLINDGRLDLLEEQLIIKVKLELPEPKHNIFAKEKLGERDVLVKENVTEAQVENYLRGKDESNYYTTLVE